MTKEQLRSAWEASLKRALEAKDAIDSADESADLDALSAELDESVAEVERTKKNYEARERTEKTLEASVPPAAEREADNRKPATARGSMKSELTYRPDTPTSFFRDLRDANRGDQRAYERLERNNREWDTIQQRAGVNQTLTSGGEFSYPVWLAEYAPKLRAGRAITDAIGTEPLPPGTNSINLPSITTASSTAVQTDGGAVSNTDLVTASITAAVQTIAGRTVTSQQILDLSSIGLDRVIFEDLTMSLNQSLDVAVINGNVANAKGILNVTGINNPTYVDASPTLAEAYPSIFQSKSLIESLGFDSPHFLGLHPSVWNNFLAGLDTATRPLALSTDMAAFNALAGFDWAAQGLVGNLAGIPVVCDANIPKTLGGGTETAFISVNRRGFDVYEGVPRFKVADQTSITTLQVQFVAFNYYAVMSRQPKLLAKVTGTGTIPVAGF
jgi:HK97 family phage major capsid protein